MGYDFLLQKEIEDEQKGLRYRCTAEERSFLISMLREINEALGTDYHYLAELGYYSISGVSEIAAKYIEQFTAEGNRAYLLHLLVNPPFKNSGYILFQMYLHFKNSDLYYAKPGQSEPAYIFARYDNAFIKAKPKRVKRELIDLLKSPRDAYHLPLTVKMISSWSIPEMEAVLHSYLQAEHFAPEIFGLEIYSEQDVLRLKHMQRELIFRGISGLQYYPTDQNMLLMENYRASNDQDMKRAAEKALAFMCKHYKE